MGTKAEGDRLQAVEELCRRTLRAVQDITERMEWFLDAPTREVPRWEAPPLPGAEPATGEAKQPKGLVPPSRLKAVRPLVWAEGRAARSAGAARSANPFRDTRGGSRNAWFGGWDEMAAELGKRKR